MTEPRHRYSLLVATLGFRASAWTKPVDSAFLPRVGDRLDLGEAVSIDVGAVYHRIFDGGLPLVTATLNHVAVDEPDHLLTDLGFKRAPDSLYDLKLATGRYAGSER